MLNKYMLLKKTACLLGLRAGTVFCVCVWSVSAQSEVFLTFINLPISGNTDNRHIGVLWGITYAPWIQLQWIFNGFCPKQLEALLTLNMLLWWSASSAVSWLDYCSPILGWPAATSCCSDQAPVLSVICQAQKNCDHFFIVPKEKKKEGETVSGHWDYFTWPECHQSLGSKELWSFFSKPRRIWRREKLCAPWRP